MKIPWMKLRTTAISGLVLIPLATMAQTPQDRIDAAFARAEAAAIPVSLLQTKLDEGKAKGIPMDRLAEAVDARLANLEKARTAMTQSTRSSDVNAAELSVGADAIGEGVSAAVLAQITASTGHDRRAVAIAALTQLMAEGIGVQDALNRVQEALDRGPGGLGGLTSQAGSHMPEGVGAPSATAGTSAPTSIPTPGQVTPPTPPQRRGRGGF